MWPALQIVQQPVEEPVALAEVKTHCRVDGLDEDVLLGAYITVARQLCEAQTRRTIIATTLDAFWPSFPGAGEALTLGVPAVTTVTSVEYLDSAGVAQAVPSSVWALDSVAEPARLVLKPDQVWPSPDTRRPNAVRARFVAGWANAAAVPRDLRAWILLHVQALYERQTPYGDALEPLPYLDALIAPHRITRFG